MLPYFVQVQGVVDFAFPFRSGFSDFRSFQVKMKTVRAQFQLSVFVCSCPIYTEKFAFGHSTICRINTHSRASVFGRPTGKKAAV